MLRIAIIFGLLVSALPLAAADPPAPIGTRIADFSLPEPKAGKPWNFSEQTRSAKATVVVFVSTSCPVSNAYAPRLAELHKRFSTMGVVFVGVNSHLIDEPSEVIKHANEFGIPFPVLKDTGTTIADRFAVERIPTVYVLDAGRNVRYKGRIDDQYSPGVHRNKATTQELYDAIAAVINGKEVPTPFSEPAGCKLTREKTVIAKGPAVTFHKDVSRVLQAKCQDCHRPGEAAPFSLMTYQQAKGWSEMIREVVSENVMPPWHADAPRGHILNDRRLTDEQKKTLTTWIEQGCPEGDAKDAPEPKKYLTGWRLGREPDKILRMNKTIDVPAQYLYGVAGMPYQYVPTGEPFAEDTWIQAIEIRPDQRALIHHVIAFIIPEGKSILDVAGPNFGNFMLGAYVPGDDPLIYPAGIAKKVPKGSQIVFEMHYTPNGKAASDRSSMGLLIAKEPPKYAATTEAVFTEKFVIPPGAENHEVKSRRRIPNEVTIAALTPHMHLRGKAFRFELVKPDGTRELLLNVPKYDFNWQVSYILTKPITIQAGSMIECTGWFDNSPKNPFNPDPKARVRWGNMTWEEMMIGFVEYIEERK